MRKKMAEVIGSFLKMEASGGLVMIFFAALALLSANTSLSTAYQTFISTPISLGYSHHAMTEPLHAWVKDVLMVFFFLLVGLELKREMREGVLSQRSQLILPLLAALGGMIAPAIIFIGFNYAHPSNLAGWAIPSATDIAFALCILTLIGKNVPPAAKVFLLAIAIFDDLGAIIIIAAFYNTSFVMLPLLLAIAGVGILMLLNRSNITMIFPYMLTGVYLWFCLHSSGIHTTIAGVIVGMAIPMRDKNQPLHSPLNQTMHRLHPWVSFLILPLFAFTSAGVSLKGLSPASFLAPLPMGIALGLFIGKQIGIFGITWLLVSLRFVKKPQGINWMHLYGISVIAGIGFTMSLFIGLLAFNDHHLQEMVKIGVIVGSILSTFWGVIVMRFFIVPKKHRK
jgi:NhaA family Na+:H+ antiporter